MRGERLVAVLLVFACAVLVTTAPVAAWTGTNLVVASQHTTDSDFQNATTLDGVRVQGSGQSASVAFDYIYNDGFEDQPADSGPPKGWTADSAATSSVQTSVVYAGSQAAEVIGDSNTGGIQNIQRDVEKTTLNASAWIYHNDGFTSSFQLYEGGTRVIRFDHRGSELVTGGGTTITTATNTDEWTFIELYNIDPSTNTYAVYWETASGNSGTSTGLSMDNSMASGYDEIAIGNNDGTVNADNVTIGRDVSSGTYISQTHSVEDAEEAFANVTLTNISADYRWEYNSGGSWTVADSGTWTTTGNRSVSLPSVSSSSWRLNLTFDPQSENVSGKLHDEGIKFTATSPSVDNSSASPTGRLTTDNPTFEINVNDSDYPLVQGDTVTAELWVDGSNAGSDSLSSNGTAQVSYNPELGQTLTYQWNLTDSYGGEQKSDTFQITTPGNITFREETNASEIISGVSATVTFYSVDATTVIRRSDTDQDGNISLQGLPDKEFIVVSNVSEHYTRRTYISSIYEQQNIFLLNSTEVPGTEAINTTFVFEDRTGEFPPENTTLRVQRAVDVNDDDTYEWMNIAGDFWGAASEFPFTGEQNARYRLVVENRQGDRRILGTHIPVTDGVKTVINGEIQWEAGNATGIYFDAVMDHENGEIDAFYTDPANTTSEVRVQVWERGNKSNEIYDQNFTNGPYGTLAFNPLVSLNSNQTDKSWVVGYSYVHDSETDTGRLTIGTPQVSLPLDPWLLAAFGVLAVTFVGTLYGPRTATIGAWMMVMTVLGLTVFGLAHFPIASIVAGLGVAAGGTLYREALP